MLKFHRNQLSSTLVSSLEKGLARLLESHLDKFSFVAHALDRKGEKKVCSEDIESLAKGFDLIEFKTSHDGRYQRYVVRSHAYDSQGYQTVAVLDNHFKVVTVWKNHRLDKHSTLDLSKYDSLDKLAEVKI